MGKQKIVMPFYGASDGSVPQPLPPGPSSYDVLRDLNQIQTIAYHEPKNLLVSPGADVWSGWHCGFMTIGECLVKSPGQAPPVPITKDAFLTALATSDAVAVYGSASSAGIYTGVEDICSDW